MSIGKLVSQGAHASLETALKVKREKPEVFETWRGKGQKKVVLKADSKSIKRIRKKSKEIGVKSSLIKDKGLTELEPGTMTALGLGPDKEKKIDKLTSSLPLFD